MLSFASLQKITPCFSGEFLIETVHAWILQPTTFAEQHACAKKRETI